uniref:Uncharacterized protein n=1 Tax=Anabas testudineus TaxID=64144 RepID=A0A3Q1II87_ANATE
LHAIFDPLKEHHPEADMGDGEGLVVADVLATRLLGVAFEGGLLISPGRFHRSTQHQDSEDEEDRQPDLSPSSRVGLDLVQQTTQSTPVTHSQGAVAARKKRHS